MTLGQKLLVLTPHQVKSLLELKGILWITVKSLTKYQALSIKNPDVSLHSIHCFKPSHAPPNQPADKT